MKKKQKIRKKQKPDLSGLTKNIKNTESKERPSYYPEASLAEVSKDKQERHKENPNDLGNARNEEHEGKFLRDHFIKNWKDSLKDF